MPSNGSFWYGRSTGFPGFLYKKNNGIGARKSTLFGPGGVCNGSTNINNKYKPGTGGVGASNISNRRAKNRHATICGSENKCFPCYMTLGQYSNYTHNPNGFVSCPSMCLGAILSKGNKVANMNTSGMINISFSDDDDGFAYLPFIGMDFYFFGNNFGNSNGTNESSSIYMNTNYAFGFGNGNVDRENWDVSTPAILFDFFDSVNFNSYVSPPQNGTRQGVKYLRIVAIGTDYNGRANPDNPDPTVKKAYEIYFVRDNCFQYMQFNCNIETVDRSQYLQDTTSLYANGSNITDGITFQNTFGPTFSITANGPQEGSSYVIRSDLNGNNWTFFPNTYLNL